MKYEHFLLGVIWFPFLITFIFSFLPDTLLILNIGPDFGLEHYIIIPNIYKQLWFDLYFNMYLGPFLITFNLFLTMLIIEQKQNKTQNNKELDEKRNDKL